MSTIPLVWRFFIIAVILIVHIFLYGVLEKLRSRELASKSLRRLLISILVLAWFAFLSAAIVSLLIGKSAFPQTFSGFAAGAILALVIEVLWSFIAPYNLPDLEAIAAQIPTEGMVRNPSKSQNLSSMPGVGKATRLWRSALYRLNLTSRAGVLANAASGWAVFIPFLYFILLVFGAFSPSVTQYQTYALLTIYFLVFTLLPDFVFTTYHMANKCMTEDVRIALFIKSLRDTLPGFVLAGSLFILWPKLSNSNPAPFPPSELWLSGLIFMLFSVFLIPAQYQRGVTEARKLKEYIINQCLTTLDVLITKPLHFEEKERKRKANFILNETKSLTQDMDCVGTSPEDFFSVKTIYGKNPAAMQSSLLNHLELSLHQMSSNEMNEHLLWLRETILTELETVKSVKPLISEWLISLLSILFSTIFTKMSENIFALLIK